MSLLYTDDLSPSVRLRNVELDRLSKFPDESNKRGARNGAEVGGGGARVGAADFTLNVLVRRGRSSIITGAVVGLVTSINVDEGALPRSGADVGGRLLLSNMKFNIFLNKFCIFFTLLILVFRFPVYRHYSLNDDANEMKKLLHFHWILVFHHDVQVLLLTRRNTSINESPYSVCRTV